MWKNTPVETVCDMSQKINSLPCGIRHEGAHERNIGIVIYEPFQQEIVKPEYGSSFVNWMHFYSVSYLIDLPYSICIWKQNTTLTKTFAGMTSPYWINYRHNLNQTSIRYNDVFSTLSERV